MYCLFCDVPCIVCVHMCTEQLPPGGYPIAVKYITYHISFSFFVTQTSNVPLLSVNKKYIILNYNPSPGVYNSLWCEQHNSATWKHFMYDKYTVSHIIIHSNGWPHKYSFKNKKINQ